MGTSGTLCVTPIFILISIYLCTNDVIVIFISFFDWFHNIHFTIPSICIILCKNTYLNKEVWGELKKITETIMELMTIIKNPFEEKGKSWKGRVNSLGKEEREAYITEWFSVYNSWFYISYWCLQSIYPWKKKPLMDEVDSNEHTSGF